MKRDEEKPNSLNKKNKPYPESRIKIDKEFRKLLEEKKFDSITTTEIAKNTGVNEALIFRYFDISKAKEVFCIMCLLSFPIIRTRFLIQNDYRIHSCVSS
jgi:hypothetical protein